MYHSVARQFHTESRHIIMCLEQLSGYHDVLNDLLEYDCLGMVVSNHSSANKLIQQCSIKTEALVDLNMMHNPNPNPNHYEASMLRHCH